MKRNERPISRYFFSYTIYINIKFINGDYIMNKEKMIEIMLEAFKSCEGRMTDEDVMARILEAQEKARFSVIEDNDQFNWGENTL